MKLIDEWKSLWKTWSVQVAAMGIALPEVLQLLADHTDMIPWLNDGYKSGIRLACLIAIPLVRAIKQPAVSGA